MLTGSARDAVLGLCLVMSILTTIFLTHLVANRLSITVDACAKTAMEQKPDNRTSRPSPSRTESGIDI
jgi:hypothetical protein